MPGPRKPAQKIFGQCSNRETVPNKLRDPVRHVLLPPVPFAGAILFHLMNIVTCILISLSQHLSLYRTMWWLPGYRGNNPIDLQAIDENLVYHCLLQICTPALFDLFQWLIQKTAFNTAWRYFGTFLTLCGVIVWCGLQFYIIRGIQFSQFILPQQIYSMIFLVYMPLVYTIIRYYKPVARLLHSITSSPLSSNSPTQFLYHTTIQMLDLAVRILSLPKHIQHFHGILCNKSVRRQVKSVADSAPPHYSYLFPVPYATVQVKNLSISKTASYSQEDKVADLFHESFIFYTLKSNTCQMISIRHNCTKASSDGVHVREEVEKLRQDFNFRFADVLMGTVFLTFYSAVVPCSFSKPSELNYDIIWCCMIAVIGASAIFLVHCLYLLPPIYLDLLHRNAMHLGGWECSVNVAGNIPWQVWSPLQIYGKGVYVKHIRGLFRSIETSNAAEPGNISHTRFYFLFSSPLFLPNLLSGISVLVVFGQFLSLKWVFEWYKLLCLMATSPITLLNLYRLIRNRFLLATVYENESPLYECLNCPTFRHPQNASSSDNQTGTNRNSPRGPLTSSKQSEFNDNSAKIKKLLNKANILICSSCGGISRNYFSEASS